MQKPIITAPVPEYDQQRQYVIELDPVEYEEHIYIGCEVRDMPPDEEQGAIFKGGRLWSR